MPHDRDHPAWGTLIDLDGQPPGPLHNRLRGALRAAVVGGRLPAGSALPPSRVLAQDLGCSRWVVTEAYAQLIAEGYLEARSGSATWVRAGAVPHAGQPAPEPPRPRRAAFDLMPGKPDLRAFPRKRWADAIREATATIASRDLGYPDPAGHPRLRGRLAAYLVRARGAHATAHDVVICGGTLDGAVRLCRALRDAGHTHVAVEDPGWTRLRSAIAAVGLVPVPVPVDEDGLSVPALRAVPQARAVLVAPAHQFPTGTVLSPARRTALLDWAREVDGLVLEDNYDAEFRYDRRPIGTLQGVDPDRVALMGSLSKTLSPALRIGWVAAPPRWTRALHDAPATAPPPPVIDQLAFAAFLDAGAYDRHLRAALLRYRARRDLLLHELATALPRHPVSGAAAGFHLLLDLGERDAADVVRRAALDGVHTADLDRYRMTPAHGAPEAGARAASAGPADGALVIGYGNLTDAAVPEAIAALARAVRGDEPPVPGPAHHRRPGRTSRR